jgi:hypothetical protein
MKRIPRRIFTEERDVPEKSDNCIREISASMSDANRQTKGRSNEKTTP